MKIKARLISAAVTLVIAMLAIAGALAFSLKLYRDSLDTMAADRVAPLRQLFVISRALTEIEHDALSMIEYPSEAGASMARITAALGDIDVQWTAYKATRLTTEESILADDAAQAIADARQSLSRFTALTQQPSVADATLNLREVLHPAVAKAQGQIGKLVDLQQNVTTEIVGQSYRQSWTSAAVTIAAGVVALVAIGYALYFVRRFILSPFGEARRALANLASGRLEGEIPHTESDEMNALLSEIRETRTKLSNIVAEQSSARQRIDEFSAQLEAVFRYSPFGIFIKDLAGNFVTLNDAEAALWGRSKAEMIGRNGEEFLPAADISCARATDRQVIESGEPISVEYRGREGSRYQFLQTVKFPVRNHDGEIIAIAAFDIDISAAKSKAHEAQGSAAQLLRASHIAGIHCWLWRRDGATGRETVLLDGTPMEGFDGHYDIAADYQDFLHNRVHPDDQIAVEPFYRDFVAGRIDSYRLDYRLHRRDGSYQPIKVWGERVTHEKTGDVEIYVVSQDISEIKARELELVEAKRHAEIADRAKTEFLANMSHELRTPLNAVLGFSEILKMKFVAGGHGETLSYIDAIHQGGQNLLSNINVILDFARLDVAEAPLEEGIVGLHETVLACVNAVREAAKGAKVSVEATFDDETCCLYAEERALRRVLTNILSNAIQASPADTRISIDVRAMPGQDIVISIADQGPGIDPELLPEIGKRFVRGGEALRQSHGGIGLGLTIAGKLMELHGGRIDVANLPDRGAIVSMVFPAHRHVDMEAARRADGRSA